MVVHASGAMMPFGERAMNEMLPRRDWLRLCGLGLSAPFLRPFAWSAEGVTPRPNIVLMMADDQGWGDTGYNGHPVLKTPHLDTMAREGIRFERFYSGAPVCSPTRGSCLTGRHPFRYGIFGANSGEGDAPSKFTLPREEITLAEVLQAHGYTTGHFGKWHLGDLVHGNLCTPAQNGFDEWFSTVRKVATVDPQGYVRNGVVVKEALEGDDCRIIMDRVEPFIRHAVSERKPFFAVIWFHSAHNPVLATKEYRERYVDCTEAEQHYWGTISAMDDQIGRLRALLRELSQTESTMLWYCSDNGPAQLVDGGPGITKGLRGKKGQLFEGGVRVPGILVWPDQFREAKTITVPCSTSDYYPTVLDYLKIPVEKQPVLDGVSLRPVLEERSDDRPAPIAFEHQKKTALIDNRYKLIADVEDDRLTNPMLFDVVNDPAETRDLVDERPEITKAMLEQLKSWRQSCAESLRGDDYKP